MLVLASVRGRTTHQNALKAIDSGQQDQGKGGHCRFVQRHFHDPAIRLQRMAAFQRLGTHR
jgi:hypothetical protein